LPTYEVGDRAAEEFDLGAANFWNGQLYAILAALCLFLGFYSLTQFLFKRNESENLYFAIMLFFSAFYLMDLGADVWIFKAVWSRALARGSLVVSMAFLVPFFAKFFGFSQKKVFTYASYGLSAAILAAFLAFAGDDSVLALIFNISLLPVMISIVLCAVMCVRAARAGIRESFPVLIAVVVGLVLAGYDSYYTIIGVARRPGFLCPRHLDLHSFGHAPSETQGRSRGLRPRGRVQEGGAGRFFIAAGRGRRRRGQALAAPRRGGGERGQGRNGSSEAERAHRRGH
jgi:hypothetical protein